IVLARCEASGSSSTGPPFGPGLNVSIPWNSSRRNPSRSVPRPIWYSSSIAFSGGRRSPGRRPFRAVSRTICCATTSDVFGPLGIATEPPLASYPLRSRSTRRSLLTKMLSAVLRHEQGTVRYGVCTVLIVHPIVHIHTQDLWDAHYSG